MRKRLRGFTPRRALGATALLAIVAGGAALALAGGSDEGPGTPAAAAAGGSGKVERRTLAERLTVGGTIGYAGESTVLARLSGTVTSVPKVGDTIQRGEQLYALNGEPVLLMYGAVPAYRELAEGVDEGPDVEQLEQNLAALGYEPGTVDEEFTSSTAAAVSAWQEDLGLEATGAVELGRVAFLPGPRRVTGIEVTLGESIGSGGGGGGNGLTADSASSGTATLVAYEVPAAGEGAESPPAEEAEPNAEDDKQKEEERQKEKERREEEREKEKEEREERRRPEPEEEATPKESPSASPSSGEGSPESSGEEEAAPVSVPVLKTSSTRRIVSVELGPDQQSVARRGQRVDVLLPGGEEAKGKVRRIAASEGSGEEAPGEESEPGVEVTISLVGKTKAPALDGAAVSVLFTESLRKHVLSVPLTALVAVGNERFAVVAIEAAQRRRIAVTPGLAADGYVEVKGKGLREGMRVETGE